jgi:hypothetical protein
VAEWSNAPVLKTGVPGDRDRGFESRPLRSTQTISLHTTRFPAVRRRVPGASGSVSRRLSSMYFVHTAVQTEETACFPRSREDELRVRRESAAAFMRGYYSILSRRHFATAWGMLSRRVRRQLGPFKSWKAGHRRSLGASVRSTRVRLSQGRAVVAISLCSRDRDACSGRVIRQYFRGTLVLAPRRDSWVAVRVRLRKTGRGQVHLSKSECRPKRRRPPRPPSPPTDCQGYRPCLPPGPDVDCEGGSGDGPRYVPGPVSVTGSDPYHLDRDGDGIDS